MDKPGSRDAAAPVAPAAFSISSAAFAQDQIYTNGGLNYSLRGYGTVGSNQQNSGAAQSNGEEPRADSVPTPPAEFNLELTVLKRSSSTLATVQNRRHCALISDFEIKEAEFDAKYEDNINPSYKYRHTTVRQHYDECLKFPFSSGKSC